MKFNFTTLFLFISFMAYSQQTKKPTYFYLENIKITKDFFKKLDERKVYFKEVITDTAVIKNAYAYKTFGKLDSIQHRQIDLFLKKIIGEDYKNNKKTMIHLYSKNDTRIKNDANYKKYWRWIKVNKNKYQAFLIGTRDSQIEKNKKNHIYKDNYNLLKHLFFKYSDFDLNHLLIKPNGEIYIFKGMEDILIVLDYSVD